MRARGRFYRPPIDSPRKYRPANSTDDFPLVPEPAQIVHLPHANANPSPMPAAHTSALSAPAKENTMKKMNDGFDSLRAAQDYLNLPVLPGPIFADEDEEESGAANPSPQPRAEPRVEVQLIHQRDFDAMKAAEAAAAEVLKDKRRRAAAKAARTRKRRLRQSRALEQQDTRDHHERHCTVCNSPDREAIEEEFVHWQRPSEIGFDYKIGTSALYRHAHARGLFLARERNMRFALGNIIERSAHVQPTADAVIRAIRAYSCLNRDGQWIEPPAHVIVSSGARMASPPAVAIAAAVGSAELPELGAQPLQLPENASRVETDDPARVVVPSEHREPRDLFSPLRATYPALADE
jgi:hypothetical protein